MHDCPECGMACDCDGEDTWLNAPIDCCHCDDEYERRGRDEDDDLNGVPGLVFDAIRAEFADKDKQIAALREENARLRAALADIAHGPVGYWNLPEYRERVISHMMKVASSALEVKHE